MPKVQKDKLSPEYLAQKAQRRAEAERRAERNRLRRSRAQKKEMEERKQKDAERALARADAIAGKPIDPSIILCRICMEDWPGPYYLFDGEVYNVEWDAELNQVDEWDKDGICWFHRDDGEE